MSKQQSDQEGVQIMGTGTERWVDGATFRVWFVSSAAGPTADGNVSCYTVRLRDGEHVLTCDCPAGQYGKVCKHRKTVHAALSAERAVQPVRPQPQTVRTTTVAYAARRGRLSACTKCGADFTEHELVTLRGTGVVWCANCSGTSTSMAVGATAARRTGSAFSMFK